MVTKHDDKIWLMLGVDKQNIVILGLAKGTKKKAKIKAKKIAKDWKHTVVEFWPANDAKDEIIAWLVGDCGVSPVELPELMNEMAQAILEVLGPPPKERHQ